MTMMTTDFRIPQEYIAEYRELPVCGLNWPGLNLYVYVLHTCDQIREVSKDERAHAHVSMWNTPDDAGFTGVLLLNNEDPELSIVAHEATHLILFLHGRKIQESNPQRKAHTAFIDHDESVAESIGNLTAMIWWNLPWSG